MNRFVDAMAAGGLTIDVTRFPEGTRTAQDAAAAIGCEVGAIVKSLVFVVDGVGPVLALTSGSNRVDTNRLGARFGGHLLVCSLNIRGTRSNRHRRE